MRPSAPLALSLIVLFALGCEEAPRRVGVADALAMASCEAVRAAPTPVTAASDPASAHDAAIHLSDTPYLVTLPASGEGHVALHTEEMHTTLALFVREQGALTAIEGHDLPESREHGVCPEALGEDYRLHVHEPGAYRLTFAAGAPRDVLVIALLQSVGHDPEADGGADHEHDGGAEHDHDGAAHHEHDGGH